MIVSHYGKAIDSFWKRAENPQEYLSILIPLSPAVCWWAWVGGDNGWKPGEKIHKTRTSIGEHRRANFWANAEATPNAPSHWTLVRRTECSQQVKGPVCRGCRVQGVATSGDTAWESISHRTSWKVETKAVALTDARRRNRIWLPLLSRLAHIQCRASSSSFLQTFMFQTHIFQPKCCSCHNNFISLFSDVPFNHIIYKKLDGSGHCLNLFRSHLAPEESCYLFLFSKKLKHPKIMSLFRSQAVFWFFFF